MTIVQLACPLAMYFHLSWGFHIGDAQSFIVLMSPLLNVDVDVKKTAARHQCENCFSDGAPPPVFFDEWQQ